MYTAEKSMTAGNSLLLQHPLNNRLRSVVLRLPKIIKIFPKVTIRCEQLKTTVNTSPEIRVGLYNAALNIPGAKTLSQWDEFKNKPATWDQLKEQTTWNNAKSGVMDDTEMTYTFEAYANDQPTGMIVNGIMNPSSK